MFKIDEDRFQKNEGDPPGMRVVMACSRLVMMAWGEQVRRYIREGDITKKEIPQKGIVRDVRKKSNNKFPDFTTIVFQHIS